MPKYIPIHTNTCLLIQYVPIRPLHIPDEGQSPAAPPPPASRLLCLDTIVTVHEPLFDLLHAGLRV